MVGEMNLILRELVEVQDQLMSLPGDAAAAKHDLLSKQDELRTRAARLADGVDRDCPTQDLLAQLAGLRRHRDAIERQRVSSASQSGPRGYAGGGGAAGPDRKTADERGLPRIEERIERIKRILSDRGIELR